jgi:hypothetical protein
MKSGLRQLLKKFYRKGAKLFACFASFAVPSESARGLAHSKTLRA